MSNFSLTHYFKDITATNLRNHIINMTKEGEVCEWECREKSKTGEIIPVTGFNGFRLKFRTTNKSKQLVVSNPELYMRSGGMYGLGFRNLRCVGNCLSKDNISSKIEFDINHTGILEYTPIKTNTSCTSDPCTVNGKNGCIINPPNSDGSLCCFDGGQDGKGCNESIALCGIDGKVTLCKRSIDKCGSTPPGPKNKNVVAYVINWADNALTDDNISSLALATHVIVAFAVNYDNYKLPAATAFSCSERPLIFPPVDVCGGSQDPKHADFINKLKTINPAIKILMSVGGGIMNPAWAKCLTTNNISNAAKKMIDLFKNPDGDAVAGYDGIDIDMEDDDSSNITNTGALVKELIKQRGNDKWLITVVPEAGQIDTKENPYVTQILQKDNVEGLDLINVQNYNDLELRDPGCNTPSTPSFGTKVCTYFNITKNIGIPAYKIVPMICTNGPSITCEWSCSDVDCSNNSTAINIEQVACAYHKIDPNFGGLGYWAFNQDNTGKQNPEQLVSSMSIALNKLNDSCTTCLTPTSKCPAT